MAASSSAAVQAGLTAPLSELGVDIESVEVSKAGRRHVVRIVVDRDGGVDLDLIAEISRRASALLDEPPLSDAMPGPFVLEVTSPGVDRPLTEARHWRRARTRLVEVTLADGEVLAGRVVDVPSDDTVVLATESGEREIARAQVARAVVQVEFNRRDDDSVDSDDTTDDGTDDETE